MRVVTDCGRCGSEIVTGDVETAVVVPSAAGFVALGWSCASCAFEGRTAMRERDWLLLLDEEEESEARLFEAAVDHSINVLVKGFEIDLGTVDDLGDLLVEWASYPGPVLIERAVKPEHRCGCAACERKWGGRVEA